MKKRFVSMVLLLASFFFHLLGVIYVLIRQTCDAKHAVILDHALDGLRRHRAVSPIGASAQP